MTTTDDPTKQMLEIDEQVKALSAELASLTTEVSIAINRQNMAELHRLRVRQQAIEQELLAHRAMLPDLLEMVAKSGIATAESDVREAEIAFNTAQAQRDQRISELEQQRAVELEPFHAAMQGALSRKREAQGRLQVAKSQLMRAESQRRLLSSSAHR
jgi:hypothetical protein